MRQGALKYFGWGCLLALAGCQSVGAGQYVGRNEFDILTRRVEEVETRVGIGPWGSLPRLVSLGSGSDPAARFPAGQSSALQPPVVQPPVVQAPVQGLNPPAGYAPGAASPGENSTYQEGQRLLKAGQYERAAGVFSRLLSENPYGRLAPNARYWLGECHYARGRYGEAAAEFRRCADDYPQSDKAADALLKLSFSLDRLGDGPQAMSALDRLLGSYPNSNAAQMIRSGRGHFQG